MKKLMDLLVKGVGTALIGFAVGGMIWDIKNGGNYVMTDWTYTKMFIGAVIVGIGFSVPGLIYYNPNIPYCIKILFHMGIGSIIFLITSFAVGWIPVSLGVKECVAAIVIELLIAFILWFCFTLHYKRMAKKMNEKIKEQTEISASKFNEDK